MASPRAPLYVGGMELRGTKCTVRTYRPGDARSLAHHGNNRKIWLNLRDRFPQPFTEEGGASYIAHVLAAADAPSFAIDVGGDAVGGISLHRGTDIERLSAEVGYWLGEDYWGRGIMTEAIRLVTRHAFTTLDLVRVFAVPFAHNAGSCGALENAGYVREGLMRQSAVKDGRMIDQYLYAIVR